VFLEHLLLSRCPPTESIKPETINPEFLEHEPPQTETLMFRGGLVFEAHRLLYHSTLGLRVIKKKKKNAERDAREQVCISAPDLLERAHGAAGLEVPPNLTFFSSPLLLSSLELSDTKVYEPRYRYSSQLVKSMGLGSVQLSSGKDLLERAHGAAGIEVRLVLRIFVAWEPRPESGLDCLTCAIFARQREGVVDASRARPPEPCLICSREHTALQASR